MKDTTVTTAVFKVTNVVDSVASWLDNPTVTLCVMRYVRLIGVSKREAARRLKKDIEKRYAGSTATFMFWCESYASTGSHAEEIRP